MGYFAIGLIASALSVPPTGLEVRFCPGDRARSYPLDTAHGATGLVIQGIAILNRSSVPVVPDRLTIELLRNGEAIDSRILTSFDLERAAAGGKALADSGMMSAIAFQFCDGALLGGAKPAAGARIAPGEAIMVLHQSFAWRGQRDAARVSAGGATATIPIDGTFAPPIRWPLRDGPWTVGAGSSFHTTHRWAVPEQFALDIFKADATGRSHSGAGSRVGEFHAYGADVLAVSNGTVVKVTRAVDEDAPMLRSKGETMEAYLGRVGSVQATKLAGGETAILGEGIVLDLGANTFAAYAHLKPGSVRVKVGDQVSEGQPIASLGNSGNSTEPHLHFQLCDKPSGLSCAGIPPAFKGIELPLADGPRPLQSGDIVVAE